MRASGIACAPRRAALHLHANLPLSASNQTPIACNHTNPPSSSPPHHPTPPHQVRIRQNMHGTLTRKFVDLMAEYQELQTKYKNKYREKVERQYRIVKPHATKEEIDQAFDSGNQQPELFTQQILQGPGHAAARSALADIQERHKDITRLETSIAELHQLFLDMSV